MLIIVFGLHMGQRHVLTVMAYIIGIGDRDVNKQYLEPPAFWSPLGLGFG